MSTKGQMAGVFFSVLVMVAFGMVLYMFHDPIETLRINALSQSFAQQPLIRIILYSLQQIIWGVWLLLGTIFVSMTAVKGGA